MFKKSLIAVAVLGATAFSVQAADVTMYGKVDTGLQFKTNEVTEGNQTVTDTDTFSMENGLNSASRFGIKGSEDLGNGMKVSFQLENGFKEALQKPLLPSRMEQKCSVQFFLTTPGGAVFLPT